MKPLLAVAQRVWRGLFFLNFGLTLILLYPFFLIFLSRKAWFPIVHFFKKIWARLITFNVGITYDIITEAELDKNKTYIFCPNHTSYLDVVLSYLAIPNYFHYVAKGELAKAPLFGVFFRKMDIAFDRKSLKASHAAFSRAGKDIDNGVSIAMFPEGTISPDAPRMARFKNGPFKLAIEKQIPIVPISFKNNWEILPDGSRAKFGGKPGRAEVFVHAPIETKCLTEADIESLKQRVYQIIQSKLDVESNLVLENKPALIN